MVYRFLRGGGWRVRKAGLPPPAPLFKGFHPTSRRPPSPGVVRFWGTSLSGSLPCLVVTGPLCVGDAVRGSVSAGSRCSFLRPR